MCQGIVVGVTKVVFSAGQHPGIHDRPLDYEWYCYGSVHLFCHHWMNPRWEVSCLRTEVSRNQFTENEFSEWTQFLIFKIYLYISILYPELKNHF